MGLVTALWECEPFRYEHFRYQHFRYQHLLFHVFLCISSKTAPSASFPSISGSVRGTSASFPSIWGNIEQDSSWYWCPSQSPKCWETKHGCRFEGENRIFEKKTVCKEGHSKLQKIAFEKISSIFSVLFLDDAFFTKRAVVGGNLRYFWVRNSVPWPKIANRLAKMEFRTRKTAKPILVSPVRDFGPRNRIPHPKIT